jgi:hypothetical protein
MVVSVSLRFLYSFLHREYINHIQGFSFPTSLMRDLPLVWPVFHNIAVFVLGLYSTYEREHAAFGLWTWLTSLKIMFSSSILLK